MMKRNGYSKADPISIAMKMLLGREVCPSPDRSPAVTITNPNENDFNENQCEQTSNSRKSGNIVTFLKKFNYPDHSSGNHSMTTCVTNSFSYFLRNFTIGWTAQVLLSIVMKPKKFFISPKDMFISRLLDRNNINFGLFLGTFTFTYKIINCSFSLMTNKSEDWHSLVAAFCAGMS